MKVYEQKTLMENQHCPVHPEIWMYFNMTETRGFCKKCQKWRNLADVEDERRNLIFENK